MSRCHPRTRTLAAIIDRLNVWAMAPDDEHRKQALKDALNAYSKAVKSERYAATSRNFAMRTGYCNQPPPILADSFESFFGASEEDTTDLPWNE